MNYVAGQYVIWYHVISVVQYMHCSRWDVQMRGVNVHFLNVDVQQLWETGQWCSLSHQNAAGVWTWTENHRMLWRVHEKADVQFDIMCKHDIFSHLWPQWLWNPTKPNHRRWWAGCSDKDALFYYKCKHTVDSNFNALWQTGYKSQCKNENNESALKIVQAGSSTAIKRMRKNQSEATVQIYLQSSQ